jgi:hypothetical protein
VIISIVKADLDKYIQKAFELEAWDVKVVPADFT